MRSVVDNQNGINPYTTSLIKYYIGRSEQKYLLVWTKEILNKDKPRIRQCFLSGVWLRERGPTLGFYRMILSFSERIDRKRKVFTDALLNQIFLCHNSINGHFSSFRKLVKLRKNVLENSFLYRLLFPNIVNAGQEFWILTSVMKEAQFIPLAKKLNTFNKFK